ncbi:MAG: hypothetical protein KGI08_11315, partial [Thaumarchaeota archaeon]|nr:hypothetical protein [Nitrososphaerota archaeon]
GFLFGIALTVAAFLVYFYVQYTGTVHTPVVSAQAQAYVTPSPTVNPSGRQIFPTPTQDNGYAPPAGNWSPDEVTYLGVRMPHIVKGLTAMINAQELAKQASQNMNLLTDPTWLTNMNTDTATMIAEGEAMQWQTTVPTTMSSVDTNVQHIGALLVQTGNNMSTGIYDYNHGIDAGIQNLALANAQMDQISTEFHAMSGEMTALEQRP